MYIGNIKCYGIVYKIENIINNKVYIGVTREERGFKGRYNRKGKGIERVYNYHLSCKKNYEYYNENLLNDIEYYGFDSFEVTEIFDVAFSMEELKIKEKSWISIYDSYYNGYNNDEGGKYTDISGTNMSIICLNTMDIFYNVRNASIEMDICYDTILKAIRNKKCVKGYIFMKYEDFLILSPAEQLQISFLPIQLRDLRVVCLNDGIIYKSTKYLRDTFGYFESCISACCRNESKSAYKNANGEPLVWRYYEDYIDMTEEEIKLAIEDSTIGNGEKVICLNTEEIFKSAREAEREYNIDGVSDCCRKEQNYCGKLEDGTKLVWRKYEDYINMTEEEIEKIIKDSTINNGKKVICLDTLEIFESRTSACKKYNIDKKSLRECCNGKRKSAKGLHWMNYEDYLELQIG